jgi:GntR family transcriptional regulator
MEITLDFRTHTSIHDQIVEQIRRLIASGELAAGQQLPTVRELAASLQVNFTTVARAYRTLDEAGLISTQHGRGTYVLEGAAPVNREETLKELARVYIYNARRLGFDEEAILEALRAGLADQRKRS